MWIMYIVLGVVFFGIGVKLGEQDVKTKTLEERIKKLEKRNA